MTGKLLRWFGIVALLALAGIGAAGLWWVQDHVRVLVQLDDADQGPDPAALLHDELRTVARKQEELRTDLAAHLTKLVQALDEAQAQRHEQLVAALAALPELQRRAEQRDSAVAAMHAQLRLIAAEFEHAIAQPPMAAAAPPGPASTDSAPPAPPSPPVDVAAPSPPMPEPAQGTGAAATTAPRRAFLSFELPDRRYRFTARQRYTLLPELSRVGFDAKSTLHDFSGVTSLVRGGFVANLGDPASPWTGEVGCRAGALVTGVDGRDEGLREHLDVAQHPEILFRIERFTVDPDGLDLAHERIRGAVTGSMTIRGTTRELAMPVQLQVDDARRVVIAGEAPLRLTDYGVPVPSQLGLISMQDEVKIWVALRARATGEVSDAR